MDDKLIDIGECAFKSYLVLDGKLKVVSIVELKYHEKQLEVPAELPTSDEILLFDGGRGGEELRDVGHQRDPIS